FELAMIAQEAVAHGLFDSQVVGSNGPDAPLELFLGIPDADKPLPLWRRVEVPEDYFILADGLPRVVLKFDFDAPEG
ncbi:hypothetical protein QR510_31435, partial [Escherichia coli]|uniref:hypothetical protein n=1 Tax=Escherichia coli TaxID=562 RepID=UPI00273A1F64